MLLIDASWLMCCPTDGIRLGIGADIFHCRLRRRVGIDHCRHGFSSKDVRASKHVRSSCRGQAESYLTIGRHRTELKGVEPCRVGPNAASASAPSCRDTKCVHPGSVFDPISARIAEDLGFEVGMFAGSIASLTVLGAPDIIALTLTEFADQAYRICRAGNLPLLCDADHGYGNAINVMRTVEELEVAGRRGAVDRRHGAAAALRQQGQGPAHIDRGGGGKDARGARGAARSRPRHRRPHQRGVDHNRSGCDPACQGIRGGGGRCDLPGGGQDAGRSRCDRERDQVAPDSGWTGQGVARPGLSRRARRASLPAGPSTVHGRRPSRLRNAEGAAGRHAAPSAWKGSPATN